MLIDVELDGKKYQELHVDGGAIAQLFLYPPSIDIASLKRERHAYIIRNARLDPDYAMAERRTITIFRRAIVAMLAASGFNDVLRTYFVSQRDKVDYNLAYIGRDFEALKKGEFDQAYMNALYEYGVREIVEGRAWHKHPPGLGIAHRGSDALVSAVAGTTRACILRNDGEVPWTRTIEPLVTAAPALRGRWPISRKM